LLTRTGAWLEMAAAVFDVGRFAESPAEKQGCECVSVSVTQHIAYRVRVRLGQRQRQRQRQRIAYRVRVRLGQRQRQYIWSSECADPYCM